MDKLAYDAICNKYLPHSTICITINFGIIKLEANNTQILTLFMLNVFYV